MHFISLRTFIAVSTSGTFHGAAEHLNITQAAVSARIRTLEQQLGQRLFERGRGGATLTAAGRELLPHAENITHTWTHATSMLGVPVSHAVRIRIGAQFSTWAQLALDWAAWFADSMPEAELDLNFDFNTDMLKAVENGAVDIAITHASTSLHGMRTITLPDETMVLVARRQTNLNSGGMPAYVRLDWGPEFNAQVSRLESRLSDSKLSIGNGMLGLRYILEHDACAYVPLRTARRFLRRKRLFRIKRAPKFAIAGHIVYAEDNPNHVFLERAIKGFGGIRVGLSNPVPY